MCNNVCKIDFSNENVKLTNKNKQERFSAMKRVISLLLMLVLLLTLPVRFKETVKAEEMPDAVRRFCK